MPNLYLPIYTPCWMLPIRISSTMRMTGTNGFLFSTMRPHRLMPTMALSRRHNGLQLFAQKDDPQACLSFLPVADMAAGKAALADWLQIDEDTLDKDELGFYTTDEGAPAYYGFPDWWENAVVFAYFGYSPECLLMPADSAYRGKIFIFEHDGGNDISQIADNLSDLFRQLATDSIGFLRRYYGMYWYDAASYHPD